MSRQNPETKRGRTYKCTQCDFQAELRRACYHFLKVHLPNEDVQYYCTLCGFRAVNEDHLRCHPDSFQEHNRLRRKLQHDRPDESFYSQRPDARGVIRGVDVVVSTPEHSRAHWRERPRRPSATISTPPRQDTVYQDLSQRIAFLTEELKQYKPEAQHQIQVDVQLNRQEELEPRTTVQELLSPTFTTVVSHIHDHGKP